MVDLIRIGPTTMWWILMLVWLRAGVAAGGVTLTASSQTVDSPGDAAELCVALGTGGAAVAGTQNDLNWDGACASLSSENACGVVGMHGKNLSAATRCGDFCLRAIILSLTDVNPIPDGDLYCCRFTVDAAPGACCAVNVTNAAASDPDGKAISVTGNIANLCVSSENPVGTPTPTPTVLPSFEDDGCQVERANGQADIMPLALAAAVLYLLRKRTSHRVRRNSA